MICRLCHKEATLRESHIVPKFIFKWLKDTGNGYLRNVVNYNVRIQDGIKRPLLCDECERRFGDSETYFARAVFYPIADDRVNSFEYSEKLYYFIISVAWRLLHDSYLNSVMEEPLRSLLVKAEEEWRRYLLHNSAIPTFKQAHLFITGDMNPKEVQLPEGFILYWLRNVDSDLPSSDTECFLYIKLPRFIFIIPVYGINKEYWINTEIPCAGGTYHCNDAQIAHPSFASYIFSRVETVNQFKEKVSTTQKEKMRLAAIADWPKIQNKNLGLVLNYQWKIDTKKL